MRSLRKLKISRTQGRCKLCKEDRVGYSPRGKAGEEEETLDWALEENVSARYANIQCLIRLGIHVMITDVHNVEQ